ncbi:uncharacterized protein N7515_003498 [Penicillium bovifimosum]|uniref:Uncharacterized protein n=1 Tax=Penicillium bovifimosum TaxID=126998 RepID=A0A9W9H4T1_9EURO|nr:uncharacterized protein N7515_003498 [Penicillium bovifimosum]KAJ5138650.1 hypothetical protein N7515_003498 [Penicillium bovifimosum]
MRSPSVLPLLLTLVLLLNYSLHTTATPLGFETNALENQLEKRCENPCGYNGWLCCESGQTCSTNSAQEAVCVDGSGSGSGGGYQYYTTTIVVTNTDLKTITSVWSSQIPAATGTGTCRLDLGEVKCGTTCCEAAQECVEGQCVAESSSVAVTATGTDAEATPPVRGTSNGASTVTETSAPTTTEGFTAPVGTDGADLIGAHPAHGGGGLSGGAIAGIVIGSIAGAFLLFLLCACMCFKGILDTLLAALGIGGKRRRKDTTYVEERHSHHSHSRPPPPAPARRTWFGAKPTGGDSEVSEKKSKWGWGTVAIILGALALCLGLKRKREREHDDDKTESSYPSSYYYYSDYYSGTGTEAMTDELETHDDRDHLAVALAVDDS